MNYNCTNCLMNSAYCIMNYGLSLYHKTAYILCMFFMYYMALKSYGKNFDKFDELFVVHLNFTILSTRKGFAH